jgi:hypothetical protein
VKHWQGWLLEGVGALHSWLVRASLWRECAHSLRYQSCQASTEGHTTTFGQPGRINSWKKLCQKCWVDFAQSLPAGEAGCGPTQHGLAKRAHSTTVLLNGWGQTGRCPVQPVSSPSS